MQLNRTAGVERHTNLITRAAVILLFLPLLVLPSTATGAASLLAITHVTIIDTLGAQARTNMTVVIVGDRIVAAGVSGKIMIPQGAQVIDGCGKFLIPGLWDMHVHLAQSETDKWTRTTILPLLIANGITGVRDMGGNWQVIQSLRREIRAGKLLGPQIIAAGAALDGPPTKNSAQIISPVGAADGRQAVISQKQRGVDFIKILSLVPREAYFAVASESKKQNLVFAGHVPEALSVVEASQAGQKSMEHLTGLFLSCSTRETELRKEVLEGIRSNQPFVLERIGNHLPPRGAVESFDATKCSRVFAVLAKNHTWQDPTLVSQKAFSIIATRRTLDDAAMKYIPAGLQAAGEEVDFRKLQPQDVKDLAEYFAKSTPLVRGMRRAGVPFLAGTDAPYPPQAGFSLHQEMQLLVKAGLTPLEALQAATLNPARCLGKIQSMGSIAQGKVADLVLLDADPLQDIANTQKINAVVLRGKYLSRGDLDHLLAGAEAAARSK